MVLAGEIFIVFGLCLVSEVISACLPFDFPASVISMLLLLALLLAGVIKERNIQNIAKLLVDHMTFFFIVPLVALMEHFSLLIPCLVPFFLIAFVTTPLVYCATAWTTQFLIRRMDRKEGSHD